MIKILKLNKVFNANRSNEICVVNNMSIKLEEKGLVAFFGKSGCGKTTLLNLIGGLDKSNSGKIEIDGKLITSRNVDKIRNEYIGYIFQNYNLEENKSVFDNVAMVLRINGITDSETVNERVMCALENVELEKFAKRRPSSLSGGQQQRVAIARAIVKCPKIILADEPTGNLDEANTIMVMDILKRISRDRLVLLVTHESDLVDVYCDQIIELVDGSITSNVVTENSDNLTVKDKNKIYLGDMKSSESNVGGVKIQFYGEQSLESSIKIIEKDGKLLIYTANDNVKFIDSRSELMVVDEKFEGKKIASAVQSLDMTALTPISHKKSKMFTVLDGIKSGYDVAFKQGRALKKMLILILLIFPIVITLLFSLMNSAVGLEDDLKSMSFNEQVVIAKIRSISHYNILNEVIADPKNEVVGGASYERSFFESNMIDAEFSIGAFMNTESRTCNFSVNELPYTSYEGQVAHGVARPLDDEIVINLGIAEEIIESGLFGSLRNSNQLIGETLTVDYDNYKIVGIANERSDYVYTSYEQAHDVVYNQSFRGFTTQYQAGHNFDLEKGEVVVDYDRLNEELHMVIKEGVTFNCAGQNFIVVDTIGTPESVNDDMLTMLPSSFEKYCGKESLIVADEFYQQLIYNVSETDMAEYRGLNIIIVSENTEEFIKSCKNAGLNISDCNDVIQTWIVFNNNDIWRTVWSVIASVMTLIMSLCIYFVMRTSLMSRVKEIGVYRAIGASRKDLIKNFFIEFVVLFMLTIFIGFMIASSFIWLIMSISPTMITLIYLPFWLWLTIGSGLFALSALCALLPLMLLIIKTPAGILAKYDI